MKNILFLNGSADLYGSDRSLLRTIAHLDKQRFRAIVVLPNDGVLVNEIKAMDVPVFVYNTAVIRKKHFNVAGIFYLFYHFIKSFFYLRKLAKREEVHVIYANTSTVTVGGLVGASLGLPYITHIRETVQKPFLYKKILGTYMGKLSSRMIAVSQATRDAWSDDVSGTKIDVIHNGIESIQVEPVELKTELQLPPDALVIGTIARIHPQKGIDYFLQIAKTLNKIDPHIYFVLIGDHYEDYEAYAEEIQEYVKAHKLTNHVFFLGFKKEPIAYLKAFDVFLFPSITPDSFPTVILEAFSQKVPVVATQQGGALEMITHGVNGLFIPIQKPLEAAEVIYALIVSETQRTVIAAKGFEKFKAQYTLQIFSERINAYLQTL